METVRMLAAATHERVVTIGEMPVVVRTESPEFARMLEERYGEFAARGGNGNSKPACAGKLENDQCFELDVELAPPGIINSEDDVRVALDSGRWVMARGDFHAQWDPQSRRGWVRQTANPYALDSVLRILHSLVLAREGGFLVHAASAVRHGRAYIFAGVSGAGKTTISRLAPPDVAVLTDEISYVRPVTRHLSPAFEAFGTPFAGELARIGENLQAPVGALYLLGQGPENRIEPLGEAEAARALLRNILFFAGDVDLVREVFRSVLDFVARVPVGRLVFAPDARVWEMAELR